MNDLDRALQKQLERNETKNMLYTQLGEIIEIDPGFLAILEALCEKDRQAYSELVLQNAISLASKTLLKRLYAINQFLQVDEEKIRDLESIYLHTWNKIGKTKNIQATLRNIHYPALSRWIASLYPEHFVKRLKSLPVIGHVVCEEYSPELQINLLKIDLRAVKQPVLDVGCGSFAGFVLYLRTLQIDAYGFDRQIEKAESYLQQSDWFHYRFILEAWGTITSNMAFTNHFLYAYHNDNAQLPRYTQKYDEILGSLAIGGSFHYAPGVQFIEQNLDTDQYRIERIVLVKEIYVTRITRMAK